MQAMDTTTMNMAQAPLTFQRDIRIVLLGNTGSGKSETGNSILGGPAFECSPGGSFSTRTCLKKVTTRFNKHILVIDTPGLQDINTPSHKTRSEIQHSIQMAYHVSRVPNPGPNAFLLCLKMDRVTAEDQTMFEECLECFGEEMLRFTIVVFTHKDIWEANMKYSGKTADHREFMQSLPPFAKQFIGKCHGTIFFNNKKTGSDMDIQIKALLKKIEHIMDWNSGNLYTNEVLQKVASRKFRNNMNLLFINVINSVLTIGTVSVFLFLRTRR